MKKNIDEKILLFVLAIMSFSFGIWTNYRQLWLESVSFSATKISHIFSVSLICSSIIIFIISFFSSKIKLKNILNLSIWLRTLSLVCLILIKNTFVIKASILLCVMCENIFSLAFYPLLSTINKSNETYKRHVSINYFCKDISIVICAFLFGMSVKWFSYDTCLYVVFILSLISSLSMLFYSDKSITKKDNNSSLKELFKGIFKESRIVYYLIAQFLSEIGYYCVFGMLMLVITTFLDIDVTYASIFIIICSVSGTIISKLLSKRSDSFSLLKSYHIKYMIRIVAFLLAVIINNPICYIISIYISYITTKLLDDKVNGDIIRKVDDGSRFLFGNVRYFILCIGDGIGVYLTGIAFNMGIMYIFLFAFIFTLISIFIYIIFVR